MTTIYDFQMKDAQGNNINFEDYCGKVLLIVNTTTKCGLAPQYEQLQALYQQYHDQGFEILDFPCNQFREQSPGESAEIAQACQLKFGTKFKIFAKIDINGPNEAPLYTFLKTAKPEDKGNDKFKDFLLRLTSLSESRESSDIKWNLTKFLINRDGEIIERFAPSVTPNEIAKDIAALL